MFTGLSFVEASYITGTSVNSKATIATVRVRYTKIPEGDFLCKKCGLNKCMQGDGAYALRIMPRGEDLMYGGLVCGGCVDND